MNVTTNFNSANRFQKRSLSMIHWNIRSFYSNLSDLKLLISVHNPDIISLSEIWLKPGSNIHINNYISIVNSRDDGRGGSAILLKEKIKFNHIQTPNLLIHNIQFVNICIDDLHIGSIYIPPNASLSESILNKIFLSLDNNFILVGDFNCHHTSWNSYKVNPNGSILHNHMFKHNYSIVNDNSPTILHPSAISIIDLIICSSNLIPSTLVKTLSDTHGSDHFPILINRISPQAVFTPVKHNIILDKFNLKKANWPKYHNLCLNFHTSPHDIQFYPHLISTIHHACQLSIPYLKINTNKKCCPWWDSECTTLIQRRKKAINKFRSSGLLSDFINAKKIIAFVKKSLKNKKKASFIQFSSSLNRNSSISDTWKTISKFSHCFLKNGPKPYFNDSLIEEFMDTIAPPYCAPSHSYSSIINNFNSDKIFNNLLSINELNAVLNKVKDSSPGLDNITYSMIKYLPSSVLHKILLFYNNIIFGSQNIPKEWCEFKIIPVIKPNKDPALANSYRPIALSSCFRKIFEHLIKNRLEWWIEHNKILDPLQFGFRKNSGTINHLSYFYSDILEGFTKGKKTAAIFLDLASAFDKVLPHIIFQELQKLKIDIKFINTIYSLISLKLLKFNNDGTKNVIRESETGLPQGSVLSPLLFNILLHSISECIPLNSKYLVYADDIIIYSQNNNPIILSTYLNASLQSFNLWIHSKGLFINSAKTKSMLFCYPNSSRLPNIILDNSPIQQVFEYKTLGMIFDHKLSWRQHINDISLKCGKILNILKYLTRVSWGGDPKTLLLLYKGLIRSRIDYGSFLLNFLPNNLNTKLDKIQFAALRICLGAMHSTPTNALLAESGEPPLHIRRQFLCNKFILKNLSIINNPIIFKLNNLKSILLISPYKRFKDTFFCNSLILLSPIKNKIIKNASHPHYRFDFHSQFQKNNIILDMGLNSNEKLTKSPILSNIKFNYLISSKFPGFTTIFTDGSKRTSPPTSSFAVYIPSHNIQLSYSIDPVSSIFTAESLAILKALEIIKDRKIHKFLIISDSLSVLKAIKKEVIHSQDNIIHEIAHLLDNLNQLQIKGYIGWIPSHIGIQGNEKADSLAKSNSSKFLHNLKFSYNTFFPFILKNMTSCWQEFFSKTFKVKGKNYPLLENRVWKIPWFYKIQFPNREFITLFIRLRLGHCCTPAHLYNLNISDSPLCACGEFGDINHIILSCPNYRNENKILIDKLIRLGMLSPLSINSIVAIPNIEAFSLIYEHIKNNKIRI